MSDDDRSQGNGADRGGGAEMPWTDRLMPCVYCGQLIPRESDRCPSCKTSYSFAVRQASREIEGPWFYLEPRNVSNRGVDFKTMLKLIEKGRVKRNSVVRGPTTHQDWMYAAEAPLLSKHLGVCPHCFGPATAEEEFCAQCDRSLDERPPRLRPGATEAKAPGYFAERDALEEQLASALAPHEMAMAASTVAAREEEAAALDEVLAREKSDSRLAAAARRPRPHEGDKRRVKPHVLALLTAATVIPLGLVMMYLPLHWVLPGDSRTPGTVACNVRENQRAVRDWLAGLFGGGPRTPAEDPRVQELLRTAQAAAENGQYERAQGIYEKLIADHRNTPAEREARQKLAAVQALVAERDRRRSDLLDRARQAQEAIDAARDDEARRILAGFSPDERQELRMARVDVAMLEERLGALEVKKREEAVREQLRKEARTLLDKARFQMGAKDYKGALATYESIANKYPAEYLPANVKLEDLIAEAQAKISGVAVAPPVEPKPPRDPLEVKAEGLWNEARRLEGQRKYAEAIKKCQELEDLAEKYRPADLGEKIVYLKRKVAEQQKLQFFGIDVPPEPNGPAPPPKEPPPKEPPREQPKEPPKPPPPTAPDKPTARDLWAEVKRLEEQQKYDEAVKKCEQIQGLPPAEHPEGLAQKIDDLKKKAEQKKREDFFGVN